MMLYGSLTMGSCYLIAALCLKTAESDPSRKQIVSCTQPCLVKQLLIVLLTFKLQLGRVTTSMFFLYYFFYGTSFAKVPWVYNSEINSLGWRVRGAAAATATNWMGGFIVTQFTKVGANNLRWKFYLSTCRWLSPICIFVRRLT
jgi:hypothetical protein